MRDRSVSTSAVVEPGGTVAVQLPLASVVTVCVPPLVGDDHVHVGQVRFARILRAVAVGVDVQMAADRAGRCSSRRCPHGCSRRRPPSPSSGRCLRSGRSPPGTAESVSSTSAVVEPGGTVAVQLPLASVVTVWRATVDVGDDHVHVGQVRFARILRAVAVGVDIQWPVTVPGGVVAVVARIGVLRLRRPSPWSGRCPRSGCSLPGHGGVGRRPRWPWSSRPAPSPSSCRWHRWSRSGCRRWHR